MCVCAIVTSVILLYLRRCCFFFQAEDGIRDLVRSRGLGDVYKRQAQMYVRVNEAGKLRHAHRFLLG